MRVINLFTLWCRLVAIYSSCSRFYNKHGTSLANDPLMFSHLREDLSFFSSKNYVLWPFMYQACAFLPPAMKLRQGNVFTSVCQEFCPQGGMCGEGGGMCGEGGCECWRGVEGCAWQGACVVGACMAHTPPPPYTTRYGRSMRGRYTSYWNAFLLLFTNAKPNEGVNEASLRKEIYVLSFNKKL